MQPFGHHTSHSQPLNTLPPTSAFTTHPHSFASSSSNNTTSWGSSPAPTPPHAVPFGTIPGSQPGVLGWGVGMSAANGGGAGFGGGRTPTRVTPGVSVGWGQAQVQVQAQAQAQVQAGPSSPSAQQQQQQQGTGRRRRRSATPESSDGEGGGVSVARPVRQMASSAKRARMVGELSQSASEATGGGAAAGGAGQTVGDLGKALGTFCFLLLCLPDGTETRIPPAASLDKPSLLSIFSSLLSATPSLAPLISSLLPTPTLSTLLSTLTSLERAVLSAIPTGAFVRDEYVFSRTRTSLEEYVAEARRFLSLVVPSSSTTSSTTSAAATDESNLTHPSTSFQFLHALTSSLLRLESALPPPQPNANPASPLAAHLTPLLLNAWQVFLSRLSSSINQQGRVFPQSVLLGWFEKMDELCPVPPAMVSPFAALRMGGTAGGRETGGENTRRLMAEMRERARREVGWLVGWKAEPTMGGVGLGSGGGGGMVGMMEEEEL